MTTPAAATTPPPPPGMFDTPDLHSVSSTAPLAAHIVQRAIGALKSDAGGAGAGSAGGFRPEHDAKRVRSLTVTCLFDGADSAAVADAAGSFQQLVLQVVESLCAHGIAAEQAHNSTSSYSVELAAACVSDGGDSAVGAALGPLTATGVASLEASDAVLTGSHAGSEASLWQSVSVGQDPFFAAGSTVLLVPKQQAAAAPSGHSTFTPAADVIAPRPVIGALGDFVALHDDDPFLATEVIIRAVETFTAKRIAVQRALHQPSVNTTSSTRERSSSSPSERAATSLASAVMEPAIVVQISVARARAYTAAQQQQLQPPAAVVMSHAMITLVFCSTQSPTGALLQHIAHAQLSAVTDNDDGTPAAQPPPPLPVARTSLAWFTGMALHEALVARTNVFVAASLSEADESARRWLTALHAMIHPPIHGFATRRHRVTIAVALNALNAALQQPFGTPHYAALPDEEDDDDVHARSSSSTGAPYVELPVGCAALPASAPSGVPCVPRSLIQSGDAYFVLAMADVAVVRQSLPLIQRCVWLRRFLKTSMSAVRRGVPMLTPALRAHATEQLKKTLIPSSDLRLVVQWAAELAHVTELDPAAMPTTSERRRVEAMVRFHRSDAAPATRDTTVSRRSASTVEPAPRLGSPQSRGVSKLDDDSYVDDDEMAPSRPPHIVPTPLRWTRQPEGDATANAALWLSDGNSPAAALQHQSSEFVAVTPPTLSWRRDTVAANLLETPPPAGAADASSSPTHRGPLNTRDASVGRDDRELPHETRSVAVSTVALEATSAFVPVQQTSLLLPPKRTTTSSTNTPPAVAPVTTTQTAGSQTTVSGDVITLAEVSQLLDEERQQHSNAGSQSPHDSTLLTAASTMRPLAETDGEDAVPPVPDANVPAMHSAQGLHRSHQHGEQVSSSSSSAVGRDDDDGDAAQTHSRSAPAGEEDEGGDVVTRDDLEELLEALRAWKQRAEELVEENDKLHERLASSEENVAALQLQLTLSQKREKESAAAAIRHAASKEAATPPPSSSSQKHTADDDDALAALRDERAALEELVRTLRGEAVAAESRHRTTMDDMDALLQRTCDQRDILQAKYDAKVLENQRLAHDTDMWRLAAQAAQEGRGDYEARVKSMQQEIDRLKADIASREALSRTASSADMSASSRIPVLTRTVSLLTDPVPAPLPPPPPPSAAAEVPRPSMATVGVDPVPELNRASMTTGCDPVPPPPLKAAAVQTLEGPRVVGRASSPVAQLMAGWVPAQEAAEYKKRARAADITLGALQAELDQAAKDKVNLVASLRAAGSALADAERRADASNGTSTEKLAQLQQENADLRAWVAALRAEGEKLVAAAQASERDRADLLNVNESLKVLNGMMMQNQLGGQGALSPRQHHGLRDDPSPLLRRPAAVAPGGVARHGTPVRTATAGNSLHHVPSTNPTMTGQLSYITPTDQQHFGGFFVQHGASNAMRRSPSNEPPSPPSHAPTTARTSNTANGAALSPSSATARYGGASAGKRS